MSLTWFALDWPLIEISGPDAITWLDGIVTCDVKSTIKGDAVWGTLLNKQGKVQAEFHAVLMDQKLYLGISGGEAEQTLTTLDGYLVMEDAELGRSNLKACWLIGPSAAEGAAELGLASHRSHIFDQPAVLCVLTTEQLDRLRLNPQVVWGNDETFDEVRVSAALPKYGVDYSEADNLHASGLERKVVDWQKGCYLGQEVVCMQEMRGKVRQRLVQIKSEAGQVLMNPGELKNDADEVVGICTSAKKCFGMARLKSPENTSGTRLWLFADGGRASAIPVVVT